MDTCLLLVQDMLWAQFARNLWIPNKELITKKGRGIAKRCTFPTNLRTIKQEVGQQAAVLPHKRLSTKGPLSGTNREKDLNLPKTLNVCGGKKAIMKKKVYELKWI